ncbi:MAG: hypothetical protein ACE5EK_10630, partial [Nitrospinales bacterium]
MGLQEEVDEVLDVLKVGRSVEKKPKYMQLDDAISHVRIAERQLRNFVQRLTGENQIPPFASVDGKEIKSSFA